jgi:tripartite-type tricarboxylate transporter receptor subunit TctC
MRILLGFPPGASGDALARALAEKMTIILGEPVYVENHPGAHGRMALDQIRHATPDGTSILFTPLSPLTSAPWLYSVDYDAFLDFKPLVHVATFNDVLVVGPEVCAQSLPEYAKLAQEQKKACFYSANAAGGSGHLAVAEFALRARLDLTFVPYKGTANALVDLLCGRLAAFISNVADVGELIRQHRVRPIGVASRERARQLPDVPTFREQGFDIEGGGSFGIYAPPKMPSPIAAKMVAVILEALRDPVVSRLADKLGLDLTGYGPEDLARIQKADYERSGVRIKAIGFKVDE